MHEELFWGVALDNYFTIVSEQARAAVDDLEQVEFRKNDDEQILGHIVSAHSIEPLTLYEDEMSRTDAEEIKAGEGGTQVTVIIPFTGDHVLWKRRPSILWRQFPRGRVVPATEKKRGELHITLTVGSNVRTDAFATLLNEQLRMIRENIAQIAIEVGRFNSQQLPGAVLQKINQRRKRLTQHDDLPNILKIPIKQRAGTPPLEPIVLQERLTKPLPTKPEKGREPEPGIEWDAYEKILRMVRHVGRTFERTPATFRVHDEEELRDIMLAFMNGYFEGKAAGEAFRKKGKTDIWIEQEDRAAFVAECKIWTGQKDLIEAVGQLRDYLTWRDCKAALLIFNKHNKRFKDLECKAPNTIREHSGYLDEINTNERGEWRFVVSAKHDPERQITVQLFLFDLFI